MKFNYQGRTQTGKIQSGVVEAANRDAAFETLKAHGLYVTALEGVTTPFYAKRLAVFERVGPKEIVVFSRELAIMFRSKVGLVEIFQTIADQTTNSAFREKILKISEAVEGGTSLSGALAMHPDIFSKFYVSMVRSGEASGKLTEIFLYLADYLEKDYEFRSKILGALVYPAFIMVVFFGVLIILITYVIPQLATFLKDSGQQLPLITQFVIGVSEFATKNGLYILVAVVVLGYGIFRFLKSENGGRLFNDFLINIPLVGSFMRKIYLTRFAMNLSTLISGGLPIVQSLEITSEVVGNETYRGIILKTMDQVKKGEKMSTVLKGYPKHIPAMFYQMIVVGEKSGTIDTSLSNVVLFYEQDVNKSLDGLTKLIEPLMIVFLGIIVAGLVISVLMPIYSFGGM